MKYILPIIIFLAIGGAMLYTQSEIGYESFNLGASTTPVVSTGDPASPVDLTPKIRVDFEPGEILEKRTYNTKTIRNGDGSYTLKSYTGDVHYMNNGQLTETDIKFIDDGTSWIMEAASYKMRVNKDFGGNGLIRYKNEYKGADHTIDYEPRRVAWIDSTDLSDMVVLAEQQSVTGTLSADGTVIRYENAFGTGIHFEVSLRGDGFVKEIIVDSMANLGSKPSPDHRLTVFFEYTGLDLDVKRDSDGAVWDETNYQDSLGGYTIEEAGGETSRILPAFAYDALGESGNVRVFWTQNNGKLFQAKVISNNFLAGATFPVRADTVTAYTADTGDGNIWVRGAFATARAATSGTVRDTAATDYIATTYIPWLTTWEVDRTFWSFDTSPIPTTALVTGADLDIRTYMIDGVAGEAHIVESTAVGDTALTGTDFDNVGSVSFGSFTHSGASLDVLLSLNSPAITHIQAAVTAGDYTKLAIMDYRDFDNDSSETTYHGNDTVYSADEATVAYRPSLSVTYKESGSWWDSEHLYRIPITIASTSIDEDLSEFPVYVDLEDLPTEFHTNVLSTGCDIRMVEPDDATETAFELEFYDDTTDDGELYFMADTLWSGHDTTFYMYYGSSTASCYGDTDTYGTENTWNADYKMVIHMDASMTDSIGDHTTVMVGSYGASTTLMGKGLTADGTNDYSYWDGVLWGTDGGELNSGVDDDWTLSVLAWPDDTPDGNWFYSQSNPNGDCSVNENWGIYITSDVMYTNVRSVDLPSQAASSTDQTYNDEYVYTHAQWDGVGDGARIYTQGVFRSDSSYAGDSTGATCTDNTAVADWTLGVRFTEYLSRWDTGTRFIGTWDEVRAKAGLDSDAWIAAEYENVFDTTTFMTIGDEEEETTPEATTTVNMTIKDNVKFIGNLIIR